MASPTFTRSNVKRRDIFVMLARICPEKGVHLAIDAAKRADAALLIAGQVYPYRAHLDYFDQQVAPRLDARRRRDRPRAGRRQDAAASMARAVLAPYTAPETSSLVAMEAMSAGAPVIAFRSGALPRHRRTWTHGFLVDDVDAMANAICARRTSIRRYVAKQRTHEVLARAHDARLFQRL